MARWLLLALVVTQGEAAACPTQAIPMTGTTALGSIEKHCMNPRRTRHRSTIVCHLDDGPEWMVGECDNGKKHGIGTKYHENGTKAQDANYRGGIADTDRVCGMRQGIRCDLCATFLTEEGSLGMITPCRQSSV